MGSNTDKLMQGSQAPYIYIITHNNMAPKRCTISHDHMDSYNTVVADMRPNHNEAFIPNGGFHVAMGCSAVNGDMFANKAFFANFKSRVFTLIMDALGRKSKAHKRKNFSFCPNCCAAFNNDMGVNLHILL